jgi:hypothetical protein
MKGNASLTTRDRRFFQEQHHERLLTMKWSNRTAQGFSPGKATNRLRPESISNPQSGCNTDRAHRSNSNPISYEQTLSRTRTTTRTRTMCLTRATERSSFVHSLSSSINAALIVPTPNPGSVALTGRFRGASSPRAEALGCSIKPFHG